jgi:transposase
MDNLNTHTPASLYESFAPEEAKRIRDRLEIHHTPKHGSWLNMAEIELSVLNNHGLSARIPTIEQMRQEVSAWNQIRNEKACTITRRTRSPDTVH